MKIILRSYKQVNCNLTENQKKLLNNEQQTLFFSAEPIKMHWLKCILVIIPLILSIVGLLLLKYYKQFRVKMFWKSCQINEATHLYIKIQDNTKYIEPIIFSEDKQYIFFFQKLKYKIVVQQCGFMPFIYPYLDQFQQLISKQFQQTGLNDANVSRNRNLYGQNIHYVEIPSYSSYIFDIMTEPLFILQYLNSIVFILKELIQFSVLLVTISWITTTFNYFILYYSFTHINDITKKDTKVTILRKGSKIEINSIELVAGDIYIPQQEIFCDCILLQGDIYINESNISGQSFPIGKFPVTSKQSMTEKNRWLYQGSKVINSRRPLALVIKTGFSTRRSRILHKVLNRVIKKPQLVKTMVWFMLQCFILTVFIFLSSLPFLLSIQIQPIMVLFRFFDFFAYSFPLPMPIYINIAYSFCLIRLLLKKISCIQPQKTVESTDLATLCFDKTGTLTQKEVKIVKVLSFSPEKEVLVNENSSKYSLIYKLFGCCHSVQKVKQTLVGDSIDLQMFLYSQFKMKKPQDINIIFEVYNKYGDHLTILKINQYQSQYQSMSVLVYDRILLTYFIFVKGSPQKLHEKCIQKFMYQDNLIEEIAINGLRCILFGYRQINQKQVSIYLQQERHEFLKGINILGIVVFENKLKQGAVEMMNQIVKVGIDPIIITGDNMYVAIETARQMGVINPISTIIILDQFQQQSIIRKNHGKLIATIMKYQNQNFVQKQQSYIDEILLAQGYYNDPIVINANLLTCQPKLTIPKGTKIFSRTSPQMKAIIVKNIKESIDKIYKQQKWFKRWFGPLKKNVGMVGDGANDLIALRQADVGYAISGCDSSYGASFSIHKLNDICEIIKFSKCTSRNIIQGYRYYGLVNYIRVSILLILIKDATYYTNAQLIFVNFGLTILIAITIYLNCPTNYLSKQSPCCNFLGGQNQLIFWGTTFIYGIGFTSGYLYFINTKQFKPNPFPQVSFENGWSGHTHSSTVTWLMLLVPSITILFNVHKSSPWKLKLWQNPSMCILVGIEIIIVCCLFLLTSQSSFFNLIPISIQKATILLIIMLATTFLAQLYNFLINYLQFHKFKNNTQSQIIQNLPTSHNLLKK